MKDANNIKDGNLRVSDKEREQVAAILREHYTAGRLDLAEFEDRTEKVYASRTYADLAELTRDLPVEPNRQDLPITQSERSSGSASFRELLGLALPMLFLIAIWAVTGRGYFWPIWPLLCWGFVVGSYVLGTKPRSRRRHRRVRRYDE